MAPGEEKYDFKSMAEHSHSNCYELQVAGAVVASATLPNRMDEEALQAFRRERLAAAVQLLCKGNKTQFGRLLGYKSGAFVRQLLEEERPITEKTTRQIEQLRGMRGWFTPPSSAMAVAEPPGPYGWPFERVTLQEYSTLSADQRAMVETFVDMILKLNTAAKTAAAQPRHAEVR